MSEDSRNVTSHEEEQYRVMDEFSKSPTPLEKLIKTLLHKLTTSYLGSVFLIVLLLYVVNYGLFLSISDRMYPKWITDQLLTDFFNPIFLAADGLTILFCAWFVRYQSSSYVRALHDIRHLIHFPRREEPHSRKRGWFLIRILYDPLNMLSRESRSKSTLLVGSILVLVPLLIISRFPVSQAYQHIWLYLAMFITGSWIIVPFTWDPPSIYRGINKNLWSAFGSQQANLVAAFTLSIAFSETTWVTYIPTMWARGFFQDVFSVPTVLLHIETWLEYMMLFAVLSYFAHVICSVTVGVFFLWDRRLLSSLDPLDGFGSGGLRPLGLLVERGTLGIAVVLATMFLSRFMVYPVDELRKPYYLQLATGSTVLIIFSFIVPVLILHWQIKKLKRDWIENCQSDKMRVLQENKTPFSALQLLSSNLAEGYARIKRINDWPVSRSAWLRVLLTALTPLFNYFVSIYIKNLI
jgi:hypothetical protein